MIYDLFMFGGYDNDLLEIRLNTLANIVDKFIICESQNSHNNKPKDLYFLDNFSRFDKWKDKIIYKSATFNHSNPFHNDWSFRNLLFSSISNPKSSDIVISGDLDEIPKPEILTEIIKNLDQPSSLEVDYYFFCCDLWGRKDISNLVMKYDWIKEPIYKYRDSRSTNFFKRIESAGWHFSSVGKPENIIQKWKWFCHSNEIKEEYKNTEYIIKQIKRKAGSWDKNAKDNELKLVEHVYPNLPHYLILEKEKFKHLFYENYKNL